MQTGRSTVGAPPRRRCLRPRISYLLRNRESFTVAKLSSCRFNRETALPPDAMSVADTVTSVDVIAAGGGLGMSRYGTLPISADSAAPPTVLQRHQLWHFSSKRLCNLLQHRCPYIWPSRTYDQHMLQASRIVGSPVPAAFDGGLLKSASLGGSAYS